MFAIIDTETTGGNPVKDRIMEIAVILHDGERVVEEFATLINPGTPIAPFIVSLTGITNEMVQTAPTFEQIADTVQRITDKSIFVAHNCRFDYSVVRREFKRMGVRFQRKQLCTVTLSQKLLPGKQSYSLGKLCREIGIPVEKRHRALGDARATALLFGKLLGSDKEHIINHVFTDELEGAEIPPHLSPETVDDLPEETGVYYFLDDKNKILFVGKSRNIRKRVIDHILKDIHEPFFSRMKDRIYDVQYEITGSELVAQLMEFEEIERHAPPFNFTRRKKQYSYGIYSFTDENGLINLGVDKIQRNDAPLIETISYNTSMKIMKKLVAKYELNPALCGMGEDGVPALNPLLYNPKVQRLLTRYHFEHPNFFIISDGRAHHEQSVIWVENNRYKGFGYFEPENIENDIQSLIDVVKPSRSNPDATRLIKNWMKKKMKDEVIKY